MPPGLRVRFWYVLENSHVATFLDKGIISERRPVSSSCGERRAFGSIFIRCRLHHKMVSGLSAEQVAVCERFPFARVARASCRTAAFRQGKLLLSRVCGHVLFEYLKIK